MNKLHKKTATMGILITAIATGCITLSENAQALSLPSTTYHMEGTTITIKGTNTTATPVVQHASKNFKTQYDCNKEFAALNNTIKSNHAHVIWQQHDNCIYNTPAKAWSYGPVNYTYVKRSNGTIVKYNQNDTLTTITTKTKYINANGTFMSEEQISAMQKTYNFFKVFRFLV